MTSGRVVLLGIDGMDFDYVSENLSHLPEIAKLAQSGAIRPFRSVFPPDSIPSWMTCFTGKDPSEHGILESVDYLAKGDKRLKIDAAAWQGTTFWDRIGQSGHQVCVINPFMAYPVWAVNGVMVNGPVFIDGQIQTSNQQATAGITIPKSFGGIVDFPTRKTLSEFIAKTFADTTEQAEFGLAMLDHNQPDLFFQTFLTMDRIQHFLWRYCDPLDPTYPGVNPYSEAIRNFYIFIDQIIGKFLAKLQPGDRLLVISDHGHGMRCTHCININEILRQHGYVRSLAEGKLFSKQLFLEKVKNFVLNFMHEHNLEDHISSLAKLVPNAKKIKKGKHITQNNLNTAYASDFAGTNPFGGVCINRDRVADYEVTRTEVINLLLTIKVNEEPVFAWIRKREEMFSGEYLERLPDILFSLKSQYGVNWNLHTPIITVNPTHKKVSGGHKEDGVFFCNLPGELLEDGSAIAMNNFFVTLLSLFDLDGGDYSKGKNFIRGN